ncbi:MAG: hypothetical protein JNM06_23475 [Blastocatellia bacterium]|nr:hypothetical protein [Blastocatellia bacterium]
MSEMLAIPKETLATFAVEVWRLTQNIEKSPTNIVALRYSLRKLRQALEVEGCVFLDLTGKNYDSGLAIEVVDIESDNQTTDLTELIIKEMLVPIILFQGKLLVSGQVILAKPTLEGRYE